MITLDASTIDPSEHAFRIQEATEQDREVVLIGTFKLGAGEYVKLGAPHDIKIRGDGSGVKPTIEGGGKKDVDSNGKEVGFHSALEIDTGHTVTIDGIHFLKSVREAIGLRAGFNVLIKNCWVDSPIPDQPPLQTFHTAVGFIMKGNAKVAGGTVLETNVFNMEPSIDWVSPTGKRPRTLGIFINLGGFTESSVRITANIINDATGRGIEFRDYLESGMIDSNRIIMSPKGVLEPGFLANGIRCGTSGIWQITGNTIECKSPDSGGILLLGNPWSAARGSTVPALSATTVEGNTIIMSLPNNVLPADRAVGIELFQNCTGNVVRKNRISGLAQGALSIQKGDKVINPLTQTEVVFNPTGNRFIGNDHWALNAPDVDIAVGLGVMNTVIDIPPSTSNKKAVVSDFGTGTKITGPYRLWTGKQGAGR